MELKKGNHNISSEIKRYENVTREDVMRVYKQYIKNRNAVIMNVSPKNPFSDEELVLESFNPNSNIKIENDPQYSNLQYVKPNSNYDICCRNKQPEPKESIIPKVPEYYTNQFENGIKVIGTEYSEVLRSFYKLKQTGECF